MPVPPPPPPEMAPLIERARALVGSMAAPARATEVSERELACFVATGGILPRRSGAPQIVVGDAVGLELGHPATASQAAVLTTRDVARLHPGRITVVGAPGEDQGDRRPLAQLVLLAIGGDEAPDPFALENAQLLTHRLPGYMVRSIPGRLWGRVSREALDAGWRMETLGRGLLAVFGADFPTVVGVEVILVCSTPADVEALAPVAAEARVLSGRHRKLVLAADGEAECSDLDCDACDEKPVCDSLREIVIKHRTYRRERQGARW